MQVHTVAMLAFSTVGFCTGGIFLKRFADTGETLAICGALTFFFVSNIAYAHVLAQGLAQGTVMSSMAHLVLMCLAGALLYGERFGERQFLGLMFALAAAWLFATAPKVEA